MFIVRVPVLSTESTVVEPKVWIDLSCRVSTLCFDMRHAPSARKIVSTTGISSGIKAMASVSPVSTPLSQSPRVRA